jgi:hypothetical protein
VRRPRGGGLMTREKSKDSGHESESDECSGRRHIHCGAIANPARAAHRYIPSSAVISTQAFTTRHSSLASLTIRSRAAQGMNKGTWQNLLHNAFT